VRPTAQNFEFLRRANRIDSKTIGGIATTMCCEPTAREATALDLLVFFLRGFNQGDVGRWRQPIGARSRLKSVAII
jgi:nicotinamidase-related amidase